MRIFQQQYLDEHKRPVLRPETHRAVNRAALAVTENRTAPGLVVIDTILMVCMVGHCRLNAHRR